MTARRILTIFIVVVIIGLGAWFWWRFYFPFSEGVKAGHLNYIEKKGYLFKTWEGRILQEGFRANPAGGMGSIEFRFSIADDKVAQTMERHGGNWVEVRYKEYLHPIGWRGASQFIVTEIISTKEIGAGSVPGVR